MFKRFLPLLVVIFAVAFATRVQAQQQCLGGMSVTIYGSTSGNPLNATGVKTLYNGADISCNSATTGTHNNGQITVTATGGSPTYMYKISSDGGATFTAYQASNVFSSLAAGSYTIRVKDSAIPASCEYTMAPILLVEPPVLAASTSNCVDDHCQSMQGAVQVNASGGTGLINITWTSAPANASGSPSGSAQPVPNTPGAGGFIVYSGLTGNVTYNFVATDANGCTNP